MSDGGAATPSPWATAKRAAALLAIDPAGLGGVNLRALPGPVRERWLAALRDCLPAGTALRRVPLDISDDRLLGGLDLAATLRAGRPVAERGVLAEADGGLLLLAMAERLGAGLVARIAAVLDRGETSVERDGFTLHAPVRTALVALDEGIADDEHPPAALLDRLAFLLDLAPIGARAEDDGAVTAGDIAAARARLPAVRAGDDVVGALCAAAQSLGIESLRAPQLALRVARCNAALEGRDEVSVADAALAARYVLAPRATQLPATEPPPEDDEPDEPDDVEPNDPPPEAEADDPPPPPTAEQLEDLVLAAAAAAMPPGLLAQLAAAAGLARARAPGRAGAVRQSPLRGRPAGIRRGVPRAGARMNLIATLRAAAPWQKLRRAETAARAGRAPLVEVRRDDFRVTRYRQPIESTTVFVVDASGSSALHRLAEAKGAVELLLAECYVRRDRVAVIAFRGRAAELLLPPTRALARAKRSLAGLPGGGGTPLAAGLDAAASIADAILRRGGTPTIVVLTDGRANVARDGAGGRERAHADALAAARRLRAARVGALLIDTSPQPQPQARAIAVEMAATYLALPHADALALSRAVTAATPRAPASSRNE
jgi:magnesium chelatase subunit D